MGWGRGWMDGGEEGSGFQGGDKGRCDFCRAPRLLELIRHGVVYGKESDLCLLPTFIPVPPFLLLVP